MTGIVLRPGADPEAKRENVKLAQRARGWLTAVRDAQELQADTNPFFLR